MLKAIVASCLLLCVLQTETYAQTFSYPGFIVRKNGENVKGEIIISNTDRTIREITFKSNGSSEILNATSIAGFGRDNMDYWIAATVSYHLDPLEGDNSIREFSDKTNTETVFLMQVIKGRISLYQLQADERKYFFVSKDDGPVTELVGRARYESDARIEDQQYKNLLIAYANELGAGENIKRSIAEMNYKEWMIKSMIIKLNGGKNASTTIKNTAIQSSRIEIGVGGVITNFSSESVSRDMAIGDLVSSTNFEASFSPRVELAISFASNDRYKKLKGNFALGLSTAVLKGTHTATMFSFNQKLTIIDASFGAMYSFTPQAKNSFFINPFLAGYMASSKRTSASGYVDFIEPTWGVGMSAGYSADRFRIALRGEYSFNAYNSEYAKIHYTRLSLGFHYSLVKF